MRRFFKKNNKINKETHRLAKRVRGAILSLENKKVEDVMIPRRDIIAIDIDTSFGKLLNFINENSHSRIPIYRNNLDEPLGMVHLRDIFKLISSNEADSPSDDEKILEKICRELLYVPPSMNILDLFLKMQARRIHLALVVDEYGGTDGIISIEDIIEEIFGEIHDEYDKVEKVTISETEDGNFIADARVEIKEAEKLLNVNLHDELDSEVDTLGGLIFTLSGRIPERGEVIIHPNGIKFDILEANNRTINKIRIRRDNE